SRPHKKKQDVPAAAAADWPGGVRTCGAGFIPASAGGAAALAWVAAPSAGIKPAPQKSKQDVPAAAAADWPGGVRTCGAGFIPASAGGAAASAWVAAPSAGIKPAPQKSKQDVPADAAAGLARWGENCGAG